MSRSHISITMLLLAAGTMACVALTLKELEASYEGKCSEITVGRNNSLETLRNGYLTALRRIEAKYQKAGNLDAVLLLKDEAISIENGKWPLPALREKISLEVSGPRKIFLKSYLKIEQDAAKDLVDVADKMLMLLDSQTTELTISGDLANAQIARQIKTEIEKDAEITGARKLVGNVRSDGSSRPAFRIRRFGDNIEVLVSYDMQGKISMDSPIRNAEESDKSIGDTKAKVLGEFVGAKGYEVDPHTLYDQNLETDGAEALRLSGIKSTRQPDEEGKNTLKLALDTNSTNPYGSIRKIAPHSSAPGATRVMCRYFIPKSNKFIKGLLIGQRGVRVLSTDPKKLGSWIEVDSTGESSDEDEEGTVRLYLIPGSTGKIADAGNDFILIGDLKIEIVRFAAFVIQHLDENGTIVDSFEQPEKQPLIVSNGELIPQTDP